MTSVSDPTKYLHKIWHVKTNSESFCELIEKKCTGAHDHVVIEAANTVASGRYPQRFAEAVHRAVDAEVKG